MSRLSRCLVGGSMAIAIWLSDRWLWTAPALVGVVLGVVMSRRQRPAHQTVGWGGGLGALLVMASFLYLYVLFLIFELGREGRPSLLGLLLGLVMLPLLLCGVGQALIGKGRIPRWLSRVWEQLLEER